MNGPRLIHCITQKGKGFPAGEHVVRLAELAKAAGVPAFIDLMVSESSQETKTLWRDGLAAVERMSREKFSAGFDAATVPEVFLQACPEQAEMCLLDARVWNDGGGRKPRCTT